MAIINITGAWWAPSKGYSKAPGALTFSEEDGLRLRISNAISVGKEKIILGSADGNPVTLQGCYETASKSRGSPDNLISQEFLVDTAYLGAELTKPSHFQFRKASFSFTHLIDWAGISGIQTSFTTDGHYNLTYRRPDDIAVDLGDGTLTLQFAGSYPLGGPEVTIRESVCWEVTQKNSATIDDLLEKYITPLWNILRLGSMRDSTIEKLVVYRKTTSLANPPIQVVFRTGYRPTRLRSLSAGDMLFSLRDIRDIWPKVLKEWLQMHSKLKSVIDSVVDPPSGTRVRLTQRFLNLAQAAEVYHRLCCLPKTDLPPEQHNQRIEEILSNTPEVHKGWLKRKLEYSNEPSLRQRLKVLVQESEGVTSSMLPGAKIKKSFVDKVVTSRNELTHRLRLGSVRDEDLYVLSEFLYFLVNACLLNRAGIDKQRLGNLFGTNSRYLRATNHVGYLS